MNQSPTNHEELESSASDLDWLAFRYICHELTEPEEAAFLEALASDQAACEALARQSLLLEATRTCLSRTCLSQSSLPVSSEPAVAANRREPSWQGLVALLLTTAAVLALVIPLLRGFQNSTSDEVASDLALRWANGIQLAQVARSAASSDISALESGESSELLATNSAGESSEEASLIVPNWMFAAVSVQGGYNEELPSLPVDTQPVEN